MRNFEFRPFEEDKDLEHVLEWLLETKLQIPGTVVNAEQEREQYFKAVRMLQLREKDFCQILNLNGNPAGYLNVFPLRKKPEQAMLEFCYLIPELRGSEASGLIVRRTVELAETHGCREICLHVHPRNERAIGFYEKNGWEFLETTDNGMQRMIKTL